MSSLVLAHERVKQRALQEEKVRRLEMQLYQKDPMSWLKDRFKEDPLNFQWSLRPGYENHKWDGDIDPLYAAWQALADGQWAGIEAATGTSKTYMLSRIVFWYLDCFPNSLVVTSAPKQDQLKLHLWSEIATAFNKFKRIRPKAALYGLRLVVEDEDANDRENEEDVLKSKSWQAVGFVAGVGTVETSATKAQGFHRKDMLIITEETPGMPEPVMTAFKNTSVGGKKNVILAVGNPDSQLDPLHNFCMSPKVRNFRVSAYDYPNVVLKDDSLIPGAVTIGSIRRRIVDNGKQSDLYKSRVRGIAPSQGIDSLIQLSWVERAITKKLVYDGSYHAVGVDVANSIDGDKACLAWGKGNILKELHEFQCANANHLAYNLFMESGELAENGYNDYETSKLSEFEIMDGLIGVDAVGVGVATINTLTDNQYHPVALHGGQWEEAIPLETRLDKDGKETQKPMYKFQGLRSQMFWEAREDLRQGLIHIDIGDDKKILKQLKTELITIRVKYKDNFIAVESKDDIKKRLGNKSPNMADAFVYWNWVRKGYRLQGGFMPMLAGG